MLEPEQFLRCLTEKGFGPFIGVPCSYLEPIICSAIEMPGHQYLQANNEGEALAIATGIYLTGKKPVVLFQNSGIGNLINPLTSLNYIFHIPILLLTTLRGAPNLKDEPQHELMGEITRDLFELLRVKSCYLPKNISEVPDLVDDISRYMCDSSLCYGIIVEKGDFKPKAFPSIDFTIRQNNGQLRKKIESNSINVTKKESLAAITKHVNSDTVLIATTGMISRELFYCNDRPGNLYVVGSMGCASSIGLGIALYEKKRPVIVLDGDGAVLMRLEAMASVGHYQPHNLIHVILDNLVYSSTGGQPSMANTVDFSQIALACGYASATQIDMKQDLINCIRDSLISPGPHLIHMRILPNEDKTTGRPTITPNEVKERFMCFLTDKT